MNDLIVDAGQMVDGLKRAPERFDVIVVGGGQAGLSVGYHLKRLGVRFVILDANGRVGDGWRKRWDSLHLFSPAMLDGLDGMPFPAHGGSYPSKDEMADYLEGYARHFELPVRTGTRVERLFKQGDRYVARCGQSELHADQVVVAMSDYQVQRLPAFARELRKDIVQLKSTEYKNPSQLKPGAVLVVGGGNSGAEIALDLVRSHTVRLVGPDAGAVPVPLNRFFALLVLRVVFHYVMSLGTFVGRKVRPTMQHKTTPLIRTKRHHLRAAGVELELQRVERAEDGLPVLTDGRKLDVQNVVWCTGFHGGFSWIDLPVFDAEGEPRHETGVTDQPGFYFVGLAFLYSMSSSMVHGVGRDAERIARAVAARAGKSVPASARPVAGEAVPA